MQLLIHVSNNIKSDYFAIGTQFQLKKQQQGLLCSSDDQFKIHALTRVPGLSTGVSVVAYIYLSEPPRERSARYCSPGGELTNEKLSDSPAVDPFCFEL
jgi:hypothetical protein